MILGYSMSDFPFPHVWHIKNNTDFSIGYKIIYKSIYPDYARKSEIPADAIQQLGAGKEKDDEWEPTSNVAFTLYPARIEISSAKGKTVWVAPTPGYYNITINHKNDNFQVDATPWAPLNIKSKQEDFIKKFKNKIEYYFNQVKPAIDKFLLDKQQSEYYKK